MRGRQLALFVGVVVFFLFFFLAPVFWIPFPDGCVYHVIPPHTYASLSYYLLTIGVVHSGGHFQWQAGVPFCV
jgi:hypothetical protein